VNGVQLLLIVGVGIDLVNDATALTLFTIAVAAVNGEHTGWGRGVLEFLRAAFVGVAIGLGLAVVALWIRKRLGNATLETSLVLLLPFTAYLAAEQARASGILTLTAAAAPAADVDEAFEHQRNALGAAVRERSLTEEMARELIEDIDLRQAARHTGETSAP
jgi:NhaP-type Na+/H+ or K+/H+ antiporter